MDEVDRLLRDLLQLMSIAEEWDMPKLKEKLESNIIHKFDMIQRLPHLNDKSTSLLLDSWWTSFNLL
jgi:hypothetical protein